MTPRFKITNKTSKIMKNTLNDLKREVTTFRANTPNPSKKELLEKNMLINIKNIITLYREMEITGQKLSEKDKKAIEGYKKIYLKYKNTTK